ncbi:hypothetical protein NHX12_001665 [Muraenolepis orangiensis]|uniref:Uncharacterized protein n=1 Tax=Muraenolepis orangiensis TaxID=630683 RepID=A0A9Q0IID6_9TELE|nr:hypothetical protein NHX12_001665 [Muraenolepis orangiensis]
MQSSYPCCEGAQLESDVGNSYEQEWNIGHTPIARYPGDSEPCVPPCKVVSSGKLSLDGDGCPNVTLTAYYNNDGYLSEKTVHFIGQECPAPPEAIVTPRAPTRHHYGRSIIGY